MRAAFLVFMVFAAGCSFANAAVVAEIPAENTFPTEVYFCPGGDCAGHLIENIESAQKTVHCAVFDLDEPDIIRALARKSQTADVKIVMDKDNDEGQIKGDGTRWDNNNQLSHNKFCVFDNQKVWTGSFNPTVRDNTKNNNNALLLYSSHLADNYEKEFQEIWNGTFGDGEEIMYPVVILNGKKIENYFCPEDRCKEHVINALSKAEKSIHFMTFSFTDEEIADAVLFKNRLDVKGIFEKSQGGSEYSQYWRLNDFGLNVIKDTNPFNMHHKVFIIDSKTVVTGSYNPSGGGSYRNDENVLIIEDEALAQKFEEEFEGLWEEFNV